MKERIEEIRASVESVARAMVEFKEQVSVTSSQRGPEVVFHLKAVQSDLRRLIGTSGSNFDALSTLVWSMGNQEPKLKTRLLRFEAIQKAQAAAYSDADPSDLLTMILTDMGIPSLATVTTGQMRAILERAGRQAEDLRMYLLTMRADVPAEARKVLEKR